MNMITLTMKDRLMLKYFYPQKNYGLVEYEVKEDLQKAVWPSLEEMKKVEMEDLPNGGVSWNTKKEKALEVQLTKQQIDLLKDGLKFLDENKMLNDEIIDLALKIKELQITIT